MSVIQVYRCECDGCGEYGPTTLGSGCTENAEDCAVNGGWRRINSNVHLCPKCAKTELGENLQDILDYA